jgi:hypothetical protein
MKKIIVMAIIPLMFFSCQKKEEEKAASSTISDETSTAANALNSGFVLRVNTSLYTLENDTGSESDKTKWAASMNLGESLSVGETRRVTFAGDGKIYDFVEVRRDTGSEGLAFASQIAGGGRLAVVVDEKASLYKSPKAIDVTGLILPRKTLLVLFPETERDGFVEIKAYDPEAQAYRQNSFIRAASISRKDSDIQSSILLQTAQSLKNEGTEKIRRDALLDSALLDYSDSVFNADIQALVNPNTFVAIKTQALKHRVMIVNDDNVNVRDIPDMVAGKVIGQLNMDDEVTVSEQTVNESTIGGQLARWYRIIEPLEGWIFGIYLE